MQIESNEKGIGGVSLKKRFSLRWALFNSSDAPDSFTAYYYGGP